MALQCLLLWFATLRKADLISALDAFRRTLRNEYGSMNRGIDTVSLSGAVYRNASSFSARSSRPSDENRRHKKSSSHDILAHIELRHCERRIGKRKFLGSKKRKCPPSNQALSVLREMASFATCTSLIMHIVWFYANNRDNFHIRTILKRTFCAFKSRWFLQRINLIPPKNCTCKADVMLTKAVRLQRRTSALQRWKEPFVHLRTDNLYYANIIITIIIIISCNSSSFTYNQSDLKLMRCSLRLPRDFMDHRTTEGELLVNKENQQKTDVPVILKTRKNAVPSWLQWLVSFITLRVLSSIHFREVSRKNHARVTEEGRSHLHNTIYIPYTTT